MDREKHSRSNVYSLDEARQRKQVRDEMAKLPCVIGNVYFECETEVFEIQWMGQRLVLTSVEETLEFLCLLQESVRWITSNGKDYKPR